MTAHSDSITTCAPMSYALRVGSPVESGRIQIAVAGADTHIQLVSGYIPQLTPDPAKEIDAK